MQQGCTAFFTCNCHAVSKPAAPAVLRGPQPGTAAARHAPVLLPHLRVLLPLLRLPAALRDSSELPRLPRRRHRRICSAGKKGRGTAATQHSIAPPTRPTPPSPTSTVRRCIRASLQVCVRGREMGSTEMRHILDPTPINICSPPA